MFLTHWRRACAKPVRLALFIFNTIVLFVLSAETVTKTTTKFTPYRKPNVPSYIDLNVDSDLEPCFNLALGTEKLLYVDADIIVVDKPSFAQTAPGFREKDSLATRIQETFKLERTDHMVVHRLDYATSGVLVFARNIDALRQLNKQFRSKHYKPIYKRYSAVVEGCMPDFEGVVDLPIGKDPVRGPPLCRIDVDFGKECLTHWQVRDCHGGLTHVQLFPKTGRTHQLRVHMASVGHPILGDLFYAPKPVFDMSSRLLLHAEEIRFRHPRQGHDVRFTAECPFGIDNIP
jgi:tRNA pseudouridine32 synthase/23S rRNA pseudouridine746 synthase